MRNQELKETFLAKCNNRMKSVLEQAFKLEDTFGKNIFELGYNEAEKLVEMLDDDRRPATRLLKAYTGFAILNGYSTTNVNVFKMLDY
jgi:hypothetical protein